MGFREESEYSGQFVIEFSPLLKHSTVNGPLEGPGAEGPVGRLGALDCSILNGVVKCTIQN
jgi:hypothetical protein